MASSARNSSKFWATSFLQARFSLPDRGGTVVLRIDCETALAQLKFNA
jgi:hypothetical protein